MMKHTDEGSLFTEIILAVFKLNGLLVSAGDQLTKDLGLTSARWKVLGALSEGTEALTVPDIARKMGQSRQAVQRLTNELIQDGLLETQHNPHHERAKLLLLTDKGEDALKKTMDKQIPWANAIAKEIKENDLQSVASTLKKLNDNLSV
jgi:DNA-binding MarR family transcriptional regulator